MPDDVLAAVLQQRDGLGGEPFAVPQVGQSTGHPADLRAADGQPVVVKLLSEADVIGSAGIEGEVDDGALGPQQP